jgi:hypothetical protein
LTDVFARVSFAPTGGAVSRRSKTAQLRTKKVKKKLKRTGLCHYAMGITLTVIVSLALFTTSLAQKPSTPETDTKQTQKDSKPVETKPAAKLPYSIKTRKSPILNISLKAEKAKMSEVAQELSKQLKVPIYLGPERQNEIVTLEFSELTLEPALQLMAPMVYVDYEIDTSSGAPPKALGIYLFDTNQGEPPVTTVVNGATQSMLIEGNTEDGVEPESDDDKKKLEEQPLRIQFKDNLLSVKAKKQPVALVLLKIGEELGIPVEIQDQNVTTVIDAEISKLPIEDVVRQLSPQIRLFVRADLTHAERRALRIVLAEPPKATQ